MGMDVKPYEDICYGPKGHVFYGASSVSPLSELFY